MSDAYDSSAPPRRPSPIDRERQRRLERRTARPRAHASASAVSSRSVVSSGARPSRSRLAMRSSSRRLNRRRPSRRSLGSRRHPSVSIATCDQLLVRRLATERVVVAELVDELGVAAERLADDPRRPEQRAGAFGRARRVAERRGERRRPGGAFGEAAQLEEPEVGIGRRRQPLQDERQQLLHQLGAPGQAVGELVDRGAGAVDVGEAEGGQAFLGRVGREVTRRPPSASRSGAKKRRSWIAAHRALVRPLVGVERAPARCGRGRRGTRARARAGCASRRRPGRCASAARRRAGAGARRCAGSGTRRRAARRRARST